MSNLNEQLLDDLAQTSENRRKQRYRTSIGNTIVITNDMLKNFGILSGQAGPIAASNPAQVVQWEGDGLDVHRLVVTLGTVVRQGVLVSPWGGDPVLGSYQAPDVGTPQVRLQWGAGAVSQQATFPWPVTGGSFAINASRLSIDTWCVPTAGQNTGWANPSLYPVFGAYITQSDSPISDSVALRTPVVIGASVTGIGLEQQFTIQSSFVRKLLVSKMGNEVVAVSTGYSIIQKNEAGTVLMETALANTLLNNALIEIPLAPGATRWVLHNYQATSTPLLAVFEEISFS